MTKAISNSDICFFKAVLLSYEHGHFSLNFATHGLSPSSPNTIRVKDPEKCIFSTNTFRLHNKVRLQLVLFASAYFQNSNWNILYIFYLNCQGLSGPGSLWLPNWILVESLSRFRILIKHRAGS